MNSDNLNQRLNKSALYIALMVAWVAMLGSLYFSEVKGYVPCALCWYQRILMYPLAGLLAFGLLRFDTNLPYLVLPFSIFGMGVSTYHYLLEKTDLFDASATCVLGVPCTTAWINWFGFITIPFLALTGFFLITVFCAVALTAGEPAVEEGTRRPWLPVGAVIAVIIAAFAVLTVLTPRPASTTITLTEVPGGDQMPIASLLPQVSTDAASAEQLYTQACAACHGADAKGMPNLGNSLIESQITDKPDAEVLAFIRAGVELTNPINTTGLVMPPSGGRPDLSDEEILAIVHYLRAK